MDNDVKLNKSDYRDH